MHFKRYRYLQSKVNLDHQIRHFRKSFKKIKDHRATNSHYPLHELLMSVFAMFSLKYVSLLDFDTQTESEHNNLKSIYGIKEVISVSGLRKVLDKVSWKSLDFKDSLIKNLLLVCNAIIISRSTNLSVMKDYLSQLLEKVFQYF